MNIYETLTIFLVALTGFQITAMQQPDLRQQLFTAAKEGNNERVEQLMLSGAPVAPEALFYATGNGNYDVAKMIFECGVDPESPADPNQMYGRYTLFIHLVLNSTLQPQIKEKLIKLYLKCGADNEIRDPSGYSMLIDEVHNLDSNTLKLLLEHGASANAQDADGYTALMSLAFSPTLLSWAEKKSEQEHKKKAELLIRHGADVNLKNKKEETCLMKAVIWKGNKTYNKTFVKLLLKNGADINQKDKRGLTSLMCAVWVTNKISVDLLLENDANVNLRNTGGKTAFDYAKGKPEILKLLKEAQKTTGEKS